MKETSDSRVFFKEGNHALYGWFGWFVAMSENHKPHTGYWRKLDYKEEYDEGFKEIKAACDFLEKEGRWPDEVKKNFIV